MKKIILTFFVFCTLLNAQPNKVAILGVSFEIDSAFSKPEKIGENSFRLSHPNSKDPQIELVLTKISKDSQKEMNKTDKDLLMYFKSTYLGTSKPAESNVERVFLGNKISGDLQNTKIPKKKRLESYLISLSNGDKLGLGIRSNPDVSEQTISGYFGSIEKTLNEVK